MLPRAVKADLLTRRELDTRLVLEALRTETGASQRTICHVCLPTASNLVVHSS
jgi:hypothetical protein